MTRRGLTPVVLLVGHGTTRVRSSGNAARWVRDEIASTFPGTEILNAFLDESPYLSEVTGSLGDRPVVAVPLLLGGGPHVLVDLARALTAHRTFREPDRGPGPVEILPENLKILPPILEWPELASLTLEAIDLATRIPASLSPSHPAWRGRARRRTSRLGFATHPNSGQKGGGWPRLPVAMSANLPLQAGLPSIP